MFSLWATFIRGQEDTDVKFTTINAVLTDFLDSQPPGQTGDKSVASFNRADIDTPAKPTAAELNG